MVDNESNERTSLVRSRWVRKEVLFILLAIIIVLGVLALRAYHPAQTPVKGAPAGQLPMQNRTPPG